VGREELIELVRKRDVTLIEMGHTHYNEIANDGRTISGSSVWEAAVSTHGVRPAYTLSAFVRKTRTGEGRRIRSASLQALQIFPKSKGWNGIRTTRLPQWPEHGLLGTKLGPNKNGRSGR